MRKSLLLSSVLGALLLTGVSMASIAWRRTPQVNSLKQAVIERVKNAPGVSIKVEDSAESPLRVQSAQVKQISGSEYQSLTGISTQAAVHSSFPELTLINSSGRVVKEFIAGLKDAQTGQYHFVTFYDLKVLPGGTYTVPANSWMQPERVTTAKNGKTVTQYQRGGFDSPGIWLPSEASELSAAVLKVIYNDDQVWRDGRKDW